MNKEVKKFLHFNGRTIYFLSSNGTYWIALKPICEALNINFDRQYKNLLKDENLKDVYAVQPMRDTKNRLQNMVALPEFYIYGWLFQIQSGSDALQKYKWECFRVLFNYFQGSIAERHSKLNEKAEIAFKLKEVEKQLESNEAFQEYQNLKAAQMRLGTSLKKLDDDVVNQQLSLFR